MVCSHGIARKRRQNKIRKDSKRKLSLEGNAKPRVLQNVLLRDNRMDITFGKEDIFFEALEKREAKVLHDTWFKSEAAKANIPDSLPPAECCPIVRASVTVTLISDCHWFMIVTFNSMQFSLSKLFSLTLYLSYQKLLLLYFVSSSVGVLKVVSIKSAELSLSQFSGTKLI